MLDEDLYRFLEKKDAPITVVSKNVLSNFSKKKLLPYQITPTVNIIRSLIQNKIALNASDTGVGKTYMSAAICVELGRKPIIICPKTLISTWFNVLESFGVHSYDIVNYETLKNGKTYKNKFCKTRKNAPYLKIVDDNPDDYTHSIFDWNVPKDALIIIDEAHRCKNPKTGNGKLLSSMKQLIDNNIYILILSSTICQKYTDMKIMFYIFGLIPHTKNFRHYIDSLKYKYPEIPYCRGKDNDKNQALIIYKEILKYTTRIRIKDLGDMFPSNQISCQQFIADESDKISDAYEQIRICLIKLKRNKNMQQHHLAKIVKLKQEIEMLKTPIFIEQAQCYLDDGKSVAIFVNYLDSLRLLSDVLSIRCQIFGGQTLEQRNEAIRLFQCNEERIIICQIKAGGIGISLHDLHGGHPRVSLINFPDSATDLLQALGRIHRSGGKTPTLQRIICVANVEYEKTIMDNINKKLLNLSATNDGDLDGYRYNVTKQERIKTNYEE